MKLSGVIDALIAAGGTTQQIAAVVRAAEAEAEQKVASKRAGNAERQKRFRERNNVNNALSRVTDVSNAVTERYPSPLPALPPGPPNPPIPAPVVIPQSPSGSCPKPISRFPEFWSAYPKRRGTNSRHEASLKFDRLVAAGAEPAAIISGAKAYNRSMADSDPQFVKQATSWLNARLWEDYLPKAEQPQPFASQNGEAEADPIVDLGGGLRWPESRIMAKVAEYRSNPRSWIEMIGPPPGQPGCRIPQRLIDQARAA